MLINYFFNKMKKKIAIKMRCGWSEKDDLYRDYHDLEWGRPVKKDAVLFEFLLLESFQAGLSWHTILMKRANFRAAFNQYDYTKIARYDDAKVQELLDNAGIIRHRLKILSAVTNAQQFMEVQKEFGTFSSYLWKFVDDTPVINHPQTLNEIPATTAVSDALAKDLKKRGFKFLGSTTVYAFMQAVGLVNDHIKDCHCSIGK